MFNYIVVPCMIIASVLMVWFVYGIICIFLYRKIQITKTKGLINDHIVRLVQGSFLEGKPLTFSGAYVHDAKLLDLLLRGNDPKKVFPATESAIMPLMYHGIRNFFAEHAILKWLKCDVQLISGHRIVLEVKNRSVGITKIVGGKKYKQRKSLQIQQYTYQEIMPELLLIIKDFLSTHGSMSGNYSGNGRNAMQRPVNNIETISIVARIKFQ